ncbi:ABC transporter substrate-binding protein [candidate division KSB1 bacterium]|nr:ABC transporter substrate-binding protein [candidate division KSB1 bacterium]
MKMLKLIMLLMFVFQISSAQEKLVFQCQWLPQAQFAGYLVAYEKGFYQQEGLNVEISFSGPEISPFDNLIQNDVTFCTGWVAEGIARRARGAPVVNIAQFVQRSGLMFVTKKSSHIEKPQDMNGKTIGTWKGDFLIQPTIFFKRYNIKANVYTQAYSIDPFLRGAFDVSSAMYYNEYHRLYEAGLDTADIVTFSFADYDLNYPEDGIYCLEKTWQMSKTGCQKFIAASMKGWQWAFLNKKEAVDIVMQYCLKYNVATSRNHQNWMISAMESLMQVDENKRVNIRLKPYDFNLVQDGLEELNLIKTRIKLNGFFPSGVDE